MPLQTRSVIELLEARIAPAFAAIIDLSMPVLAISDGLFTILKRRLRP